MHTRNRSISLLVVVAAVLALVVGSFGTATAAGLTTKQVKKIAAKVVKKKAPKLSVKNAKTVGGYAPSDLVRATGATNDGGNSFDSGVFTDVLDTSITAPGDGLLVITGSLEFNQLAGNVNPAHLETRVALDGTGASAAVSGFDDTGSSVHSSAAVNGTIAVTAGTHDVSLQVREFTAGGIFLGGRNISVVFVPFGASGVEGSLSKQKLGQSGAQNR